MTREEAKNYKYDLDVDGYYYKDVETVINKIYDYFELEIDKAKNIKSDILAKSYMEGGEAMKKHFENRTCESCKLWITHPHNDILKMCKTTQCVVGETFYCKGWEK